MAKATPLHGEDRGFESLSGYVKHGGWSGRYDGDCLIYSLNRFNSYIPYVRTALCELAFMESLCQQVRNLAALSGR